MEKRRRARINQCLDELKSLILEAMKKDVSIVSHIKIELITSYTIPTTKIRLNLKSIYQFKNKSSYHWINN